MGLGSLTNGSLWKQYEELDDELFEIAEDVWDNPHAGRADAGQKYRQILLDKYMQEDSILRRYDNGRGFMSEERSRLSRAIPKVAEVVDRDANTVRDCAINRMYDDDQTQKFIHDLIEIERKWEERKLDTEG